MQIMIVLPGSDETYPPGHLPASLEPRRNVLGSLVRADTTVDVGVLPPGGPSAHRAGGTSGNLALLAGPIVTRVRQAEADGYDAVVVYGSLDPGAEAARSFVRIPVVGTGRATLLAAAALGDRLGGLVYEPSLVQIAVRMARAYQMEGWFGSIRAVGIPPTEMHARADELRVRLVELSRRAIDQDGAQVIVPLGLSMIPSVVSAAELAEQIGVPVVDGLAAAVRLAETLALLRVSHSPLAYPPARS